MKPIKAEYYSKSYYDNIDKVNYRYAMAWDGQPLVHMGDILNEMRQVVTVELFVRPVSMLPLISSPRIGLTLGFD